MARPNRNLKKLNFYLSESTHKCLKHIAAIRETTVSELMREGLRQYALVELKKEQDSGRIITGRVGQDAVSDAATHTGGVNANGAEG